MSSTILADSPWKSVRTAVLFVVLALALHGGVSTTGAALSSTILDAISVARVDDVLNVQGEKRDAVSVMVPHHLVADALIGRVVRSVKRSPQTVVIIGPDHRGVNSTAVAMSASSWNFHGRVLPVDEGIVKTLSANSEFRVQETLVQNEHSVLTPLPYFAGAFPDARFVLLTVRNHLDVERVRRISDAIANALGPDDLIVASVDFSHYQSYQQAQKEDETSLALLATGDASEYQKLFADSPEAVAIAQHIANRSGRAAPTILDHSNSANILGDLSLPQTTSYITAVWAQ